MCGSNVTRVFYFIPSDGDAELHLNVYYVLKPVHDITLRDVRRSFPIPGAYHFRFKLKYKTTFVWTDITQENTLVPNFEDRIVVKVLRLSWGSTPTCYDPSLPPLPRQDSQHGIPHNAAPDRNVSASPLTAEQQPVGSSRASPSSSSGGGLEIRSYSEQPPPLAGSAAVGRTQSPLDRQTDALDYKSQGEQADAQGGSLSRKLSTSPFASSPPTTTRQPLQPFAASAFEPDDMILFDDGNPRKWPVWETAHTNSNVAIDSLGIVAPSKYPPPVATSSGPTNVPTLNQPSATNAVGLGTKISRNSQMSTQQTTAAPPADLSTSLDQFFSC